VAHRGKDDEENAKVFWNFFVDFRRHALSTITAVPQGHLSVRLVNDATFRRLCRARDLLAAGYQSQIFLNDAAREACLSPFISIACSIRRSAKRRMTSLLAVAWNTPATCWPLEK
jgi:hypothetical protein